MRHVEKTVFISYRRSDESWALAIYNWLTQHGFDVFIDYLGLGSGSFEKDILDNIAARAHFLVVLTLHALDRVDEPNDWMRREIEYAIDLKRNIIPVMLHEFQFDKDDVRSRLTGKLSVLKDYNGLAVPLGYFESAMERLAQRYLNVELETVLHPPSEMAQQSAERQRTAANGAVERVDELPPELVKQSKNWPNLAHPTAVAGDHHASNAVSEASSGAVILASSVLAAPMDVTNGLSAATVVRIPPPETAVTGEVGSEPLPSPLLANLAIFQEGRSLRFEYSGDGRPPELFVVQQQPGLVEQLVRQRIDSSVWDAAFGRMLFQLLVPKGLKDALCRLSRLILVVDSHTAALPWELMIPTDLSLGNDIRHNNELDLPIALRAVVVRQVLPSKSYQPESRTNITHTAMVVANPSVEGYRSVFAGMRGKRSFVLPSLPGAEIAAQAVVDRLLGANYMVVSTMENDCSAVDVIERLMQPFRFLHIAGHGVFKLVHKDGTIRSGVLLNDGCLITAAEISASAKVPEMVFLDCCHLGMIDESHFGRESNQFSAYMGHQLCEVGVRCVLVAGWPVDDAGAKVFCETFYDQLLNGRRPFGEAVFAARLAVWQSNPEDITWGAFQAYGDPDWIAAV